MDPEKVNYHYCDDLTTTPLPPGTRVLVTGAGGYVARRLIPELVCRGYWVRCMFRSQRVPSHLTHPKIETVFADSLNKDELRAALRGIEVAYYLIHSMRLKTSHFLQMDNAAAKNFAELAKEAGVKKIIYLGGLGETRPDLSPHLRSRQEVGDILATAGVPVIRLRAAIIIGAGSASYELLKSMILHNRWIPFLPEFNSRCQPIAIRDVVKYLVGAMEVESLAGGVYPIGGKDVFTYKNLILHFAKILGKPVRLFTISWIPCPVGMCCKAYAHWLHFFISVPVNIISLLLAGLRNDVVCEDNAIRNYLPFEPLGFDEAVQRALDKENKFQVYSRWSDVPPEGMTDLMLLCEHESADFLVDEHAIEIPAPPDKIFQSICRIGGKNGWFKGTSLWRVRGFIDRLFGGIGIQRGRRDPHHLRIGDCVDFWRVEKLQPDKELLLRGELIAPGLAWLQFQLHPVSCRVTRLTIKAHFIPAPFWGYAYWFFLAKFHAYIFKSMQAHFYEEAVAADACEEPVLQ